MLTILAALLLSEGPVANPVTGLLPPSPHLAAGAPGYGSQGNYLLVREGYAALFSTKYRDPLWSQEQLDNMILASGHMARLGATYFKSDPDLGAICSQKSDYSGSGFDRGHMAPSGDVRWPSTWWPDKPKHAQAETFYLSNIVPQNGPLNQHMWATLEDETRQACTTYKILQVITGPVFTKHPKTIGTGVAVPDKVFKIIVVMQPGPHQYASLAFEVPNKKPNKHLFAWKKKVADVENDTGLHFFTNLSPVDRQRIETGQEEIPIADIQP